MALRFRNHRDIDKQKWDALVEQSVNGNIYNLSTYLDSVAPGWSAITDDEYNSGIALPLRKKWGISYIFPPYFTQQLGLIYKEEKSNIPVDIFLSLIPSNIRLIELNLNAENYYNDLKNVQIRERKNFILNLNEPFEELVLQFSRSALRNIKKAKANNVLIHDNTGFKEILNIHRERFEDKVLISAIDYANFENLLLQFSGKGMVYTQGAYINKTLIAGSIFLKFKNRLTFIISGNTAAALKNGASHLLLHDVIQKFAGQNLILDFEGSDNPAFARFYEQYGAKPEFYQFVRVNRLPALMKWLKT